MEHWFAGALDRAIRTAVQTFLAYISVAKLLDEVNWQAALLGTLFAVVVSVLTSFLGSPSFGERWGFQVAERAVKTFVQNLLAGIGTATMFDQVDWKTAFSAAVLAAFYSAGTSVLTTRAGATRGEVDLTAPPSPAHLKEA